MIASWSSVISSVTPSVNALYAPESSYTTPANCSPAIGIFVIPVENPQDYEARSNIMWTATWALNTLVSRGKTEDWMVHMLGQAVGAYTDATHGMTLAAVSLPYYRYIKPYGVKKFARFAAEVWGISAEGRSEEQLADEGLSAMEGWMKEIGLVMNLRDLGAAEDMIEGIADATIILNGGYKVLDRDAVVQILKASM